MRFPKNANKLKIISRLRFVCRVLKKKTIVRCFKSIYGRVVFAFSSALGSLFSGKNANFFLLCDLILCFELFFDVLQKNPERFS